MKRAGYQISGLILALLSLSLLPTTTAVAAGEPDRYALESASVSLSSQQAGAHADLTTEFSLSQEGGEPFGLTKDVVVSLPPGVIGNPQRFPRCTFSQLGEIPKESKCPQNSQLGVSEITLGGEINSTLIEPVYNMSSPGGDIVARFALFAGPYPSVINVRVNPVDYSLIATVEGAPAAAQLISATTTLWGVPALPVHDELRLTPKEAAEHQLPAGGRPFQGSERFPFLSNPTDCTTARKLQITAVSYQLPDRPSTLSAPFPSIVGCEQLSFAPEFSATPTNSEASAPTGLKAILRIPQNESPLDRASSSLKRAVVTLPTGLTINPAAGDGLAACSPEQVGFGSTQPSHCPDAAKIGAVELDVPALEHVLHGAVYQRTPEPGHLFRFWLVTDEQGVHLKLPAEIQANSVTGQLTTVFSGIPALGGNPQVPVEELRLSVFGGPQGPAGNPLEMWDVPDPLRIPSMVRPASRDRRCAVADHQRLRQGWLRSEARCWNAQPPRGKLQPLRHDADPRRRGREPGGARGAPTKWLAGEARWRPSLPGGRQRFGELPPGLADRNHRSSGGSGWSPLWIPQPGKSPTAMYLAGPYKDAPYSVVSRVPAQAGPFDLGTVVNRAGIYVDPETATATIKTDPLPQILEGVPIAYRTVHVEINRKGFTLNPTGCAPKKIEATVTAVSGATANPTDAFQATNCAKLDYRPKLKLSLKGGTKRTDHPAVGAVLEQGAGQANTAAATVVLPPSLFIDQNHINNPCTRVQFNANKCPRLSILGYAKAVTPLLKEPLAGPVYFRSNGGARELPDIVADLRGPIHVTLVGFIDSVHKKGSEVSRLRTRFANVPDAPVSRFTMNLFGGPKRGLLVNSRNLCLTNRRAETTLSAQNGRSSASDTRIATSCGSKNHRN